MAKNKGGRPTKMTKETLDKLKYVFLMGGTDMEACFNADIDDMTLYKYQRENPEYIKLKERYKANPILVARTTLYDNLDDPKYALALLERKGDLSPKQEIEVKVASPVSDMMKQITEKYLKDG